MSKKTEVLNGTISALTCSDDNKGTCADKKKENLLVIRSQEPAIMISERKKDVDEVLKTIPVVDTRLSQTGGMVVNFLDERCRDSAVTLIQHAVAGALTKKIKKMQPKT